MSPRAALAIALALLACACGRGQRVPEVRLSGGATLVSTESNLLASPFDVAVDERGSVYVLDYMLSRVLVLDPGGGPPRIVGREGSAPGEFRAPGALAVRHDTLWVVDRGNDRIQVLTGRDGKFVRGYAPAGQALGGEVSLLPGGTAALSTLGIHSSALARVFDPEGWPVRELGRLPVGAVPILDFTEMKAEIAKGRVPRALRNRARPVLASDGGAWAVLLADAALQRFDATGRQLWSRRLRDPELDRIREEFFRKNRQDARDFAFYPLTYVTDAAAVGDCLWLLLNTGDARPAVLLVMGPDGTPRARVRVPEAAGARQFAVDPRRRTLYLALASASVLAVPVPPDLVANRHG